MVKNPIENTILFIPERLLVYFVITIIYLFINLKQ